MTKNQQDSFTKLSNQLKSLQLDAKTKDKQLYEYKKKAEQNQAQIVSLTAELEDTTLELRQKTKQILSLKDTI